MHTQFDTNHFVYYRTKNDMICIEFRLFIGIIDALFNTEVVPYNDNSPKGGPFATTAPCNDSSLQQQLPATTAPCNNSSLQQQPPATTAPCNEGLLQRWWVQGSLQRCPTVAITLLNS